MTALQVVFLILAVVTLGSALMVVIARNLVHAALWLVVTLFNVAVLYVLLEAGFLAVAQVIIYIGAIAILFIFAVMLTRRVTVESIPQTSSNWGWAALVGLVLFAGLAWILGSWPGFFMQSSELSSRADPLRELGQALVSPNAYVIPFEVASVLLLAALIGAIMVAWERK